MNIFKCKLGICLTAFKYITVKMSFGRFDIFETVNIYFAHCLYTSLWSSADTDVSVEISVSAVSAAVEFQVDDFGSFTSKKSAVSQLVLI